MTNFLSMIVLNVVMLFGLILSLPASALAQQEVDPTLYEPVPMQASQQAAKAEKAKPAKQERKQAKAHKPANQDSNSQQLIAKK